MLKTSYTGKDIARMIVHDGWWINTPMGMQGFVLLSKDGTDVTRSVKKIPVSDVQGMKIVVRQPRQRKSNFHFF
jgi:hypothetical protein